MVIDSSALIAILFDEFDRPRIEQAIEADPVRLLSAMTKLETSIVLLGRRGEALLSRLDRLLHRLAVAIVPFDDHQADIARDAFVRYGKGRHRAGLNFGDCAAYALSVAEAEPLLFKGTDFGATDVEVVRLG
ncbi:MAG: ribonuclease VapC [Hyphomicrobiales bacterium]|jgi:ribonuclease VapC|nr:ribonuclease VapC [Hyphomicrobiales bacterium]